MLIRRIVSLLYYWITVSQSISCNAFLVNFLVLLVTWTKIMYRLVYHLKATRILVTFGPFVQFLPANLFIRQDRWIELAWLTCPIWHALSNCSWVNEENVSTFYNLDLIRMLRFGINWMLSDHSNTCRVSWLTEIYWYRLSIQIYQ